MRFKTLGTLAVLIPVLVFNDSHSQTLDYVDQQLEAGFRIDTNTNDEAILSFAIDDSWNDINKITWNDIDVTDLVFELHKRDSKGRIGVGVRLGDLQSIDRESGELKIFTDDVEYLRSFEFQASSAFALLASPEQYTASDSQNIVGIIPAVLRSFVRFALRKAITSSSRINTRIATVARSNSRGLPSNVSSSLRRDLTDTVKIDLEQKVRSGQSVESLQSVTHGNYVIHYRVAFQFGKWVVENYEIERTDVDPDENIPESIRIEEKSYVVEGDLSKFYAIVTMTDGTQITIGSRNDSTIGGAVWWTEDSEDVWEAYMSDNVLYASIDGYIPTGYTDIHVRYVLNGHVVEDEYTVRIFNQ